MLILICGVRCVYKKSKLILADGRPVRCVNRMRIDGSLVHLSLIIEIEKHFRNKHIIKISIPAHRLDPRLIQKS